MPHSSGGGSHGGGSFRSSSSYSHSSSSSSNYTYVEPFKRSRTPFPRCHTYYYYRPDGIHYVYTNKKIEEETDKPYSKGTKIFISILISICLLTGLSCIFSNINYVPKKLNTNEYYGVVDNANVFDSTKETDKLIKEFKDLTGISLIIETTYNENWKYYYYDLDSYAYESYLKNFNDENCLILVYSEPQIVDSSFNDWYWNAIQGDNTDSILTEDIFDKFGNYLQDELLRSDDFESSINKSLDYLNSYIMNPRVNGAAIALGIVLNIIGIIVAICTISHERKIKKRGYHDSELYEFKDGEVLKTCPFCGKEFLNTGFKTCPFCNETLEE